MAKQQSFFIPRTNPYQAKRLTITELGIEDR